MTIVIGREIKIKHANLKLLEREALCHLSLGFGHVAPSVANTVKSTIFRVKLMKVRKKKSYGDTMNC